MRVKEDSILEEYFFFHGLKKLVNLKQLLKPFTYFQIYIQKKPKPKPGMFSFPWKDH